MPDLIGLEAIRLQVTSLSDFPGVAQIRIEAAGHHIVHLSVGSQDQDPKQRQFAGCQSEALAHPC